TRVYRQSWRASLSLHHQRRAGVLCPRRYGQGDTCVRKRPRTWAPSSRTLAALSRSQRKIREVCFLICRSSAYSEYTLSPIMSNDYRLGHILDALFAANLNAVLSAVALHALEVYAIPTPWLHQDTTTIALYGAYADEPQTPGAP